MPHLMFAQQVNHPSHARASFGVALAVGSVVALLAAFSTLQASTVASMPGATPATPTPTGCWASPTPRPPYAETPATSGTVAPRVAHCMDDAYARTDTGEVLVGTAFVRTGARDNGAVTYMTGFLFRDVRIPRDAMIISAGGCAWRPWGYQSGTPVSIDIRGELQPQSSDFGPTNQPLHLRPRTQGIVPWTIDTTVVAPIELAEHRADRGGDRQPGRLGARQRPGDLPGRTRRNRAVRRLDGGPLASASGCAAVRQLHERFSDDNVHPYPHRRAIPNVHLYPHHSVIPNGHPHLHGHSHVNTHPWRRHQNRQPQRPLQPHRR